MAKQEEGEVKDWNLMEELGKEMEKFAMEVVN